MYLIMELNKMPQSISFTLVLKKRLSINYRNMLKKVDNWVWMSNMNL